MKHIKELIEELELNAAMADDIGEPGDGKLTMRAAGELRSLDKILTEANELLRSAYQIAKREGESTNWEAWINQLKSGLNDQHALMHPSGQNTLLMRINDYLESRTWDLVSAVDLCKQVESIAPDYGCHVALTGGCLYKEGPRKDLDLLFYRIRQVQFAFGQYIPQFVPCFIPVFSMYYNVVKIFTAGGKSAGNIFESCPGQKILP